MGPWLLSYFDNRLAEQRMEGGEPRKIDWERVVFFLLLHLGCLAVVWVGVSAVAVVLALGLYVARAMFLTAFYHRYFSHRAFRTSRPVQFLFAVLGNSAIQRGPLWWAGHHRHHHGHSDGPEDPHSPHEHTFYWAHMGWITSPRNFRTRMELVPDLARYPELRFLDRYDWIVPLLYGASLWGLGAFLEARAPGLGTGGAQLFVWGVFVSTTILFHVTCMVNSLAHLCGKRPYETRDESRNNWLVALLAMGEGWHNNHHRYPNSVRQGFRWWQLDPTWYVLEALALVGIIWDLHPVPPHVRKESAGGAARGEAGC